MHLCLAKAIFHYSASLSYSAWVYSYHTATVKNLVWSARKAVPGIAEPALAARDTALTITTTSLEMLQIKPFGSKRYPFDLVCHLYIP